MTSNLGDYRCEYKVVRERGVLVPWRFQPYYKKPNGWFWHKLESGFSLREEGAIDMCYQHANDWQKAKNIYLGKLP